MNEKTKQNNAVLIVNLGSPDAPTKSALRRYLAEFLRDKRVVDSSAWLWYPILYGIILTTRPQQSAQLYKRIWQADGAPLIAISNKQLLALQNLFAGDEVIIEMAMRYGKPSLMNAWRELAARNVTRLLVLPMYPQYSCATTASVFDGIANVMKKERFLPEMRFINDWHDHRDYILALAQSVREWLRDNAAPQLLLVSFHGTPQRFYQQGDPYYQQCLQTTKLLQRELGTTIAAVKMVFQSLFGKEQWLRPYANETLAQLPQQGITDVAVICPGFSADCLETLEEMALTNGEHFLNCGGLRYNYIPALNDRSYHIDLLAKIIIKNFQGWQDFPNACAKLNAK